MTTEKSKRTILTIGQQEKIERNNEEEQWEKIEKNNMDSGNIFNPIYRKMITEGLI